jgi:hypothetical protein
MGLYLCIFKDDDEIDGVEVGSYADFNWLRDYVVKFVELGKLGSKCPTFILHSDSDEEWSVDQCQQLALELDDIVNTLKTLPPVKFPSDWQNIVADSIGLVPCNAFESFIDVDGENLLERLQKLVRNALKHQLPILFQ